MNQEGLSELDIISNKKEVAKNLELKNVSIA